MYSEYMYEIPIFVLYIPNSYVSANVVVCRMTYEMNASGLGVCVE